MCTVTDTMRVLTFPFFLVLDDTTYYKKVNIIGNSVYTTYVTYVLCPQSCTCLLCYLLRNAVDIVPMYVVITQSQKKHASRNIRLK